LKHFITTNDFTKNEILKVFENANKYLNGGETGTELLGKTVMTLFFENSTRTRSSFEMALNRLGAKVIHLDIAKSSTSKGETLLDTAYNLNSIGADAFIIRHSDAGVPLKLSQHMSGKSSVINAGDGAFAHPTQAMLDLFTIMQTFPDPKGKKIAIVGDIKNSRVANSNIQLLTRFGLDITLVAPPHFLPNIDLKKSHKLSEVIDDVDIIMSLRTQTERHNQPSYASLKDYSKDFCITGDLIGDRNLIIMHPGPVHRNIDISDEVMSDSRTKILEQVKNGVVVRMAILNQVFS
jgi:aspartate carbamoyltransferase catalytic subunit